MKDFSKSTIKREVQHLLFSTVNKKLVKFTGLAGNDPEGYKKVIRTHFSTPPRGIILVDNNQTGKGIINTNISEVKPTSVMDCDFCNTIKKSGDEFLRVLENLRKTSYKSKIISFTFCLRGCKLEETIDWLDHNVFEGTLFLNGKNVSNYKQRIRGYQIIGHEQYKYKQSVLIYYNDGHPMISGIIKL